MRIRLPNAVEVGGREGLPLPDMRPGESQSGCCHWCVVCVSRWPMEGVLAMVPATWGASCCGPVGGWCWWLAASWQLGESDALLLGAA